MRMIERARGDIARLEHLIERETHADRRDRFRVALLALRGREKLEIAELLRMAQRTVEHWAYEGYEHLLKASAKAWQDLTPETLRPVCRCSYIPPELPGDWYTATAATRSSQRIAFALQSAPFDSTGISGKEPVVDRDQCLRRYLGVACGTAASKPVEVGSWRIVCG